MRILGLIPARGGSKGVPQKNIRPLCGKPLLQYTAEAALEASSLDAVLLSTDDEEIAALGKRLKLWVPFLRTATLAQDDTPMLPVVRDALSWLEKNGHYFGSVCLLQPTNPLRQANHIDGCIRLLEESGADTVMTVLPVPTEYNPHWVYFQGDDGTLRLSTGEEEPIPRRQELPAAFHRDGSVYVTRCNVVMGQNSLYGQRVIGYPLEAESSVNIDTLEDWQRAEALLSGKLL